MPSSTEENYLKCIFKLAEKANEPISTNAIAAQMHTAAASVTDMLKKLADKDFIVYERYKGVTLTRLGEEEAVSLIRKHRLWEVFLVEKLGFKWDEVHDIAEELEHINSDILTNKLEVFLGYPSVDPHGDPIPDRNLVLNQRSEKMLADYQVNDKVILVGVNDHSAAFLQYLSKLKIGLGAQISLLEKIEYDNSLVIEVDAQNTYTVSQQVTKNLYVSPL